MHPILGVHCTSPFLGLYLQRTIFLLPFPQDGIAPSQAKHHGHVYSHSQIWEHITQPSSSCAPWSGCMFASLSSPPDLSAWFPLSCFSTPCFGSLFCCGLFSCSRFQVHLMTICFGYVSCVLAFVVITTSLSLISIIFFGSPVSLTGYILFPAAPVIFPLNTFFSV